MNELRCPGKWVLFEVISGWAFQPLCRGYIVSWDRIKGIGLFSVGSRVWVGAYERRAGIMLPRIDQIISTEPLRFTAGGKEYELRRLEPLDDASHNQGRGRN